MRRISDGEPVVKASGATTRRLPDRGPANGYGVVSGVRSRKSMACRMVCATANGVRSASAMADGNSCSVNASKLSRKRR